MTRGTPRGQHHKGLAGVTLAGLAVATVLAIGGIAIPQGETVWHLIAAPEVDGLWQFVSIDGVDVREANYSMGLRWGKIISWNNGCNACGWGDDGERICTLALCIERPSDRLFQLWPRSRPAIRIKGDRLFLTIPGHRAELVRKLSD